MNYVKLTACLLPRWAQSFYQKPIVCIVFVKKNAYVNKTTSIIIITVLGVRGVVDRRSSWIIYARAD